jgi:paraquat-inducible protein A
LVQDVPAGIPSDHEAVCTRCRTVLAVNAPPTNSFTPAIALAALILFFPAILLPLIEIEKLGHSSASSLLSGTVDLFAHGQWGIGLVVFVFSIVLPPLKLVALLVLSLGGGGMRHEHRAATYHSVELLGRWGMLDVLLVALIVSFVKLGELVNFSIGPGLLAFALCVLMSLVASMMFDPRALWEDRA